MRTVAVVYYCLGCASIASTLAVAVLNGLSYASSRSQVPDSPPIGLAIACLHALRFIELVVLILLMGQDIIPGRQLWTRQRTALYCTIGAFLLVTSAVAGGLTAWWNSRTSARASQVLRIPQCSLWAVSMFSQGLLCGFLLILATTQAHNELTWPLSEELEASPNTSTPKGRSFQSLTTDPETEPDELTPVQPALLNVGYLDTSPHFGPTLFQRNSMQSSVDSITCESLAPRSEPDTDPVDRDRTSAQTIQSKTVHRYQPEITRSLDSPLLQANPQSSSLASTSDAGSTKRASTEQNDGCEKHIHPLFRSGSLNPPPTAAPGTMVTAAPDAGQTISLNTLPRVRSTSSLRTTGRRSRAALLQHEMGSKEARRHSDLTSSHSKSVVPIYAQAAPAKRSVSLYEKKYDLHESPYES